MSSSLPRAAGPRSLSCISARRRSGRRRWCDLCLGTRKSRLCSGPAPTCSCSRPTLSPMYLLTPLILTVGSSPSGPRTMMAGLSPASLMPSTRSLAATTAVPQPRHLLPAPAAQSTNIASNGSADGTSSSSLSGLLDPFNERVASRLGRCPPSLTRSLRRQRLPTTALTTEAPDLIPPRAQVGRLLLTPRSRVPARASNREERSLQTSSMAVAVSRRLLRRGMRWKTRIRRIRRRLGCATL